MVYTEGSRTIYPMNLFSILIADDVGKEGAAPALPAAILRNIESFKACHPGLPHILHTRESLRDFLSCSMGREVLWAFDQLLPYAYKSDLARLCLLHEYGGVYADLSVYFHHSWIVRPGQISIFRDRAHVAPWIVSNTILSAPARFPAIEAAIHMILANCHARYRGKSSLCPTGPVLLGKTIAMHCEPHQIHMGEVTNAAFRDTVESLVFVDATNGQLIGYRVKTTAGLRELGLRSGVNNYNNFYDCGVIYANDFPLMLSAEYLHKSGYTRCALADGRIEYRGTGSEREEVLVLGHFLPFSSGRYTVTLDVADAAPGSLLTLFIAQVANGRELAQASYRMQGGAASVHLHFAVTVSRNDIAVGVRVAKCATLSVLCLRIARASRERDVNPSGMQVAAMVPHEATSE